jgi:23S rRNA pseudouridine1911/1915/1917 synthase
MSDRTETFTVEASLPSERLDRFLHARYPAASRSALQRLIEDGAITVHGQRVKPTHAPHVGDVITVTWPGPRPDKAEPEAIPLNILHEDDALLVVNKSPDIAVHPGNGHERHTLVNALLHHCAGRLSGIGGVARPGIVHRLDLETSGCLVVAKDDATHLALSQQFAGREIGKLYHALVCGSPTRSAGEIKVAIARHPTHRKRMAATEGGGRASWTSYEVVRRLPGASLLHCTLHTGRTHQIRVHLEHLGYPIVGDAIYGKRQNTRLRELSGYTAPRQMLHAAQLAFTHPRTGQVMEFAAPWPEDFAAAVQALSGA